MRRRPIRVVFDANLFIQAVLSGRGPAFACFELLDEGGIELCLTESILTEVEEVLRRLGKKARYQTHLTDETIQGFVALTRTRARIEHEPPHVFDLERDRDDEVYIDLAIAVGAVYLTSRDQDLLDLMDSRTEAGRQFLARFPELTILEPVELLRRVRHLGR